MGKRSIITPQRLEDGAGRAKAELFKRFCAALKHNGVDTKVSLDCKYKGTVQEDAPLHSNTRVIYTWRVNGKGIEYETLACKFLHSSIKIAAPRNLKQMLVRALLPEVIAQRRLVPGMQAFDVSQLHCHGIALAKFHVGNYETTYLLNQGKTVEHVKLAHISGDGWLVHPGGVLSEAEMFPITLEKKPTTGGKRNHPGVVIMEPIPECEQRNELFAVAHFRAEISRAKAEGRDIVKENAHALFETDLSTVEHLPKQVFVLWSAMTPAGRQEHVSRVMVSSLYHGRNL